MAKQVKDVYGNALFELAKEENQIDEYLGEVDAVCDAIAKNPELISMMTHPQIGEDEKEKVLEDIFKGHIKDELYGLMRMVLIKGHFAEITNIFEHFDSLVMDYRNIGVVCVTTPKPLSEQQRTAVEKRLLETTDFVKLKMDFKEDESLIGGMVIRIGDRVVDSSIRTKLERLTHELAVGR